MQLRITTTVDLESVPNDATIGTCWCEGDPALVVSVKGDDVMIPLSNIFEALQNRTEFVLIEHGPKTAGQEQPVEKVVLAGTSGQSWCLTAPTQADPDPPGESITLDASVGCRHSTDPEAPVHLSSFTEEEIVSLKQLALRQRVDSCLASLRHETRGLEPGWDETRKSYPAYHELVSLGPQVASHLFRLMEAGKNFRTWHHWYYCSALFDILGEHPIPEEISGQLVGMCLTWLEWARERGYHW